MGTPETGFYHVVQDGVEIWGSTLAAFGSGPVSNTVPIFFETGNADPNNSTNLLGTLYDVYVLVDGAPYRGAAPLIAPEVGTSIDLDTSFLENGDHTVQVVASWTNPDLTDPNFQYFTRYSDPFTLSVSNIIYYPNWEDEISELGFASLFPLKTTCTNANWQIDIYDVSNQLVQTLSGYTTNGFVETNWNLVDLNGVTRTNDTEFSSVITVGDPDTKATPGHKKPLPYPSQGQWAITYQDMFGDMVNSNTEFAADYQFGSLAAQAGGAYTVPPTPGHPEYGQTWPVRFAYPNDPSPPTSLQKLADENALINLLTNTMLCAIFIIRDIQAPTSSGSVDSIRFSIALT